MRLGLHPLGQAALTVEVRSPQQGFIAAMDNREIGMASVNLGCGRVTMSDTVDPAAGFIFLKKIGDEVRAGEPMVLVRANAAAKADQAVQALQRHIHIAAERVAAPQLIIERI